MVTKEQHIAKVINTFCKQHKFKVNEHTKYDYIKKLSPFNVIITVQRIELKHQRPMPIVDRLNKLRTIVYKLETRISKIENKIVSMQNRRRSKTKKRPSITAIKNKRKKLKLIKQKLKVYNRTINAFDTIVKNLSVVLKDVKFEKREDTSGNNYINQWVRAINAKDTIQVVIALR